MSAFESVRAVYEKLGASEPFWAVLSHRQYKKKVVNEDAFFATGVREIGRQMALIRTAGIDLRPGRALDFGCGVGRLTNALAAYFEEVSGVDVSSTMIECANRLRREPGCRFICNPCPDLSIFADRQFDFIYSDITLQHIPMPASANYLAEFVRLLTDDGLAICLVPDGKYHQPGSAAERWDRIYRQQLRPWYKRLRFKQPVQIHPIARRRVEQIVTAAGGQIIHTEVTPDFQGKPGRFKPLFYWIRWQSASQSRPLAA